MSQKNMSKPKRVPKRLDKRVVGFSLLVLLVMVTPATIFHEVGHAAVCYAHGYNYDMELTAFGAYTICYGDVENDMFFKAFGGLLAAIIMMAPVAHRQVRSVPWRFIPMISLAIGHLVNALVETFAYDSYINQSEVWIPILGMSSYIIFITMILKYGTQKSTMIK